MSFSDLASDLGTLDESRGFFQLESLLEALRKGLDEEEIRKWRKSRALSAHELVHALFSLQANEPPPRLRRWPSGAVPLFGRAFFPWGALPYPREHGELAEVCLKLGLEKEASEMMQWQRQMTLDHAGRPLAALFAQERGCPRALLQGGDPLFGDFADVDCALATYRDESTTIQCAGTGCKSGLGLFLRGDAGVLAFGPQTTPLGQCEGFGLAGRAMRLEMGSREMCFQTRLAAPHGRRTGFAALKDSGYSALWIRAHMNYDETNLRASFYIEGYGPADKVKCLFFGKGSACVIAGFHKLRPRSLDRYHGPAQAIDFQGLEGSVVVEAQEGSSQMEVIPLAGDDSFWGADFLAAYTLTGASHSFHLATN